MKQIQSPFHAGEIAVQQHLGVAEIASQYGQDFIRPSMPEQHRQFFNQLSFVAIGLVNQQGYPWVVPVVGEAGFIYSEDASELVISQLPHSIDLLALDASVGQKIGLLGIEWANRRRNRVNGIIKAMDSQRMVIHVEQSFGNCPQYIQTRQLRLQQQKSQVSKPEPNQLTSSKITPTAKALIESADTFFIASRTQHFNEDPRTGIDTSHRGGNPGFVKIEGQRLYFPDFSGNRFFNTLGNIQSDNRVGLFFPNFSNGDVIFLSGGADIHWQHPEVAHFQGAERIISVNIQQLISLQQFMPLTGELIEPSPTLKHTGSWIKS